MGTASRYWRLVRIDSAGRWQTEVIAAAAAFFQQQFPTLDTTDVADAAIQRQLWQVAQTGAIPSTGGVDAPMAELCLRCFISHQIQYVCVKLETQFGSNHGFTRYDLGPFVLDDTGRLDPGARSQSGSYQSFAAKVLQSFDPDCSSLSTWTTRLVKCHPDLNAFLLERGVYLISDWALLNDTNPKQLQRILTEFHQLTPVEIQQACDRLNAYHAVYRRDRLKQRQAGIKGYCLPPNQEQLNQMAQLLQGTTGAVTNADTLMGHLQTIADCLREYRIYVRSGFRPTESLESPDNPDSRSLIDAIPAPDSTTDADAEQNAFLTQFRQQFLTCLHQAVAQVTHDRVQHLQRKDTQKAQQFLTALKLFHCQGQSMGDIAQAVGLEAQYQVTRLLNLKPFRADIRQVLLTTLGEQVREAAQAYVSPDRLQALDHQLEQALDEHIGGVFQEAEAEASTPKHRAPTSLFSQTLCHHLDQTLTG